MRISTEAVALAFLASGLLFAPGAIATDASAPVWDKAPDRSDWAKAYPAKAAQAGLAGDVKMRCSASAAGLLQGCTVISETPAGQGFGAAALSLTPGMELKPTTAGGKPVAGMSFVVPVKFEPGVLKGPAFITEPDWVRRPTQDELIRFIPAEGAVGGGRALVHCFVTDRGLMDRCSVSSEKPSGRGYGGAALALTELFVMRPMTVDGQPVGGGEINIPIIWEGGGQTFGMTKVLGNAPWIAAPRAADVAAAFPPSAVGKLASAHLIMRCGLRDDGSLTDCDTISEAPAWSGLEGGARSLIKDFRLPPAPRAKAYSNLRVDVPFDFRDPSRPAPPVEIRDPIWVRQIEPNSITKLFPAAAIKAGYDVGRANVECIVAAAGTLTDCKTVSEEPAGYGFGDAAMIVASVMQMSPWTKQGAPAEGAKVVLPIKFVLPPKAPTTTASGPSATPTPPSTKKP